MSRFLIVSNKYRLASVLVPKCASTTVISLFAALHDLPTSVSEKRDLSRLPRAMEGLDRDSDIVLYENARMVEVRQALADYAWFSVVRNPYGRLMSNYNNKINRFCANFRRDLYLRYKVVQALSGPKAWSDVRVAMPYMRSRVSYREFVGTLSKHGVDWDRHYRKQSDLLRLDEMDYTKLLRLESFHGELGVFLRDVGVPEDRIAKFCASRRLNGSDGKRMDGTPEEIAERPAVYDLYRDDFERFGYDA